MDLQSFNYQAMEPLIIEHIKVSGEYCSTLGRKGTYRLDGWTAAKRERETGRWMNTQMQTWIGRD